MRKFIRKSLVIFGALLVLIVGIPLVTVGPAKLAEAGRAAKLAEAAPEAERQGERKAASLDRVDAGYSPEKLARWACSARIKEAAYVPDSVEWTRRSQWPAVQSQPGVYEVSARFKATNRFGVELPTTARCQVRVSGEAARVIKVS